MSAIVTKYGDTKIEFIETVEEWSAQIGDQTVRSKSLQALRKRIDGILEPPVTFKRFNAIKRDRWGSQKPTVVTVTSIDEEQGRTPQQAWVLEGKKRSKVAFTILFADDDFNRALLKGVAENDASINKLQDANAELVKQLKPAIQP